MQHHKYTTPTQNKQIFLFINNKLSIATKHGTKDANDASPLFLDMLRNETSKSNKQTGSIDSCHDFGRRL